MTAPATPAAPERPRRGLIAHLSTEGPLTDRLVPNGTTDVLCIVHHGEAVIGQAWLPASPALTVAAQREVLNGFRDEVLLHTARELVEITLGRPSLPSTTPMTISVIVCTRDRPEQLRGCLKALLELNREVELLVVDNGSKEPTTARVCAELGVRCVREPRPGQTSARNCGIAATTGELVAFTDDDVTVAPNWLDGVEREFDDRLTMIATGYIGPIELDHEAQVLFEAHGGFERHATPRLFARSTTGVMGGAASAGAGANMIIRRSLFEHIGGFDEQFGAGTKTRASDDKVFYYRAIEAGYRIRYSPSRKVWHQHRADHAVLLRTMRDYGTGEFVWTGHMLRSRGDFSALGVWKWWLRHFAGDVRRHYRGGSTSVPLAMTRGEIRGVFGAPKALLTVSNTLQAGGAGPDGPWRTVPAPQATEARVVHELPAITVALASYNRRDALAKVLERLADQDLPADRYEVVVVLDGCTDGSAELVRALDPGYKLRLIEQPNRGLAVARNVGVRAAENPVAIFMDDDIEARHGFLSGHATAHARTEESTWVFGYFPPVVGDSWLEQGVRTWWAEHFSEKAMPGHRFTLMDCVDGNSSMPVELFQRLGGFDEDFTGGRRQDYELGYRCLRLGVPMAFALAAVGDHHTTIDLRGVLKNAYAEGLYDVIVATKHPAAQRQLPLGKPPIGRGQRLREGFSERLGLDRQVAIGNRLERLHQRLLWDRFLGVAIDGRYHAGVQAGLRAAGLDGLPPVPAAGQVALELGQAPAHGALRDVGGRELVFRHQGQVLARVDAVQPGSQWSLDDVVERSIAELLPALAQHPITTQQQPVSA